MKYILSLLLFTFSGYLYSQDYKPLLDDYNEWVSKYCFNGCSSFVYYTDGDTLVDNQSFKILDGYHYTSRGFLLREDVIEKKIYLKTIINNRIDDYLLYDFSLEVGDSTDMKNPISPFPIDGGYYKLDSIIPRPLVDGNEYRHYYFSPTISNQNSTTNAIWVEGVGSLSLINAPGGNPDVNVASRIACMFKEGISFYSDLNIIDVCEATITLGSPNINTIFAEVKVINDFNNNTLSIFNIENVVAIDIYNLSGKKITHLNTEEKNSISINSGSYQSGVYLFLLTLNTKDRTTLRVVID